MAPLETLFKSFPLTLVLAFASASTQAIPLTPSVTVGNTLQSDVSSREGIELDLITGNGDILIPTANPTVFANLEAGNNNDLFTFLNNSSSKGLSAIYYPNLPSANVSTSSHHASFDDHLTPNPSDAVVEKSPPAAPSPEPCALALVGIGLLGFLGMRRRQDYY
ncbi:PEP-CTERM sorting domain-containing protein [Nitrosomonas sp. Nm33]|uniref:PEP-CTERM sorting domain-containing protein n=1 Tax=Nitrosomonas sp. Nm33 TaxID=133724 RepID=UPI0008980D06|nr:PEP-CTERM sorting domain-containing protein [Nitrosomonas sp. Nm33]SDX98604.1 PEP-CTERM protein-sorting domain-containing protein [Nitrosomonas sp. Nm33]